MKKTNTVGIRGVGRRINEARKNIGYTSNELSETCDISAEYLRQIESESKTPSLPVFISICNALEISSEYLLQDTLNSKRRYMMPEFESLWKHTRPREHGLISAMLQGASEYAENENKEQNKNQNKSQK